ncbi:MAG: pyridine nucleotide-disulfide oxidoreductase [Spongiibacteraceae bacterium]|nr:pyridine nucleotide-disulfide oxidoreductase [Spongiibacteraceae bacterium]
MTATRSPMNDDNRPTVVLVGAGHAHLHIANQAADYIDAGARLILIDPGKFWYSGMATGLLGGRYAPEQDQIEPGELIRRCGGEFIQDHVTAVDTDTRTLTLESGETLKYDWLSLNVGSEVDSSGLKLADDGPRIWPVKPIPPLFELREKLEAAMRDSGQMPPVVVIGGGATGSELTANLAALARRNNVEPRITLVSSSHRLLPDAPAGASRALDRVLEEYSVDVRLQVRARRISSSGVVLDNGECVRCAHVLTAVGLQAKALTRELGLTASRAGLRVNECMQSVDDPHVFAAGDCADYAPRNLPKLGVFGVKAAAVIHHNLLAGLRRQPLKPYKPQRIWLAILNLGDGRGLLIWWRIWWLGRLADWLKDRIDQQFMAQYRN